MTPLQTAKCHCANYQSDGSCLGVYYNKDGSIRCVRSLAKCLLADPIQRCPYFEEYIMPMKLEDSNRFEQEKKRQSFEEGVHQYRMAIGPQTITRLCARCGQRDTGNKKTQYCLICREVRRKESHRICKARYREAKRTRLSTVLHS
jgi:hypothetical protein